MDLAAELAELPRAAAEEVDDALGEQGQHEQKVGDGQVHDEHVRRRPERRELAEDFQDERVADEGGGADEEVDKSEEVVPGRMDGLVSVPVGQEEAADVGRRVVVQCESVGQRPRVVRLRHTLLGHGHGTASEVQKLGFHL